jgi:SAM-dependent methyltransferase
MRSITASTPEIGAKRQPGRYTDRMLPCSEACERNKEPILAVLREELATARHVLEIGSGTGQHAVHFARHLRHLTWQSTELLGELPVLDARIANEGQGLLPAPLALNVEDPAWPVIAVDAVFTANTLHIMAWSQVESLFRGIERVLMGAGLVCIYGPFNYGGDYTSESNAAFDAWLRARDSVSGIRDFDAVDALARNHGLVLRADHALPANNRVLVWQRSPQASA